MRKYFLKLTPLIIIFFVWVIFVIPYFLNNKVPFPSNYQVNNFAPWSANSEFWGPVKNGAMPDIITQIYPWRYLAIDIWKSGQIPLWNPYTFSGTPLLANYQSGVLSPFNFLFFILPFVDAWSMLVFLQPLLAGTFMHLFTRSLGVGKIGSIISSISFMFCGFITTWMGYATLGYAILFLPISLYCIEKYFTERKNIFLLLLSLTIPLSFFSGHFQISLYFLTGIMFYLLYKFIIYRRAYDILFISVYIFFGILLSMPQILPSMELYQESFRGSFFQEGGLPLQYAITFLAPDFFGNPVTRNTWFGHYAEWNGYIGILPFMFAIYCLTRIKNNRIIFLFIFGIISLLLSTSNPISIFFQKLHIPVFSSSSINRIIVLYSFVFSVLAGFGFDYLISDIKNSKNKIISLWLGLFLILFITLWSLIFFGFLVPLDKINIARQNLILPTILFLASIAIIVFYFVFKKFRYLNVVYFITIIGFIVLVTFDLLRFTTKWQPFDPKSLVFYNFPSFNELSKILGVNRIFGNLGGEASIYYKLPSVEGYDALYSKRYGQFIKYIENGEFINSAWSVVEFSKNSTNTPKIINFLNIKYIVHKTADDNAPWTFPYWIYPKGQFNLIHKDNKYEFYKNNNAFPRAFLVNKYQVINDEEQILETIFSKNFDLGKEIILEKDPQIKEVSGDIGNAKVLIYKPNYLEVAVNAKNKSLLFLSDSYFPGWKAFIGEKSIPILRANYAFRAIVVDKGESIVKFSYEPWSFKLGIFLALVGLMGMLIVTLISKNINHLRSSFSSQTRINK